MHKRGKILVAVSVLSFLLGVKIGDMYSYYLVKLLEKISVKMTADQVGAIFLNYDTFNRILMILFGIVFCTFGMSLGLMVDRIKEMKKRN